MIQLRGTPIVLDVVWRPIARTVLATLALLTAAGLAWLGLLWWVPVPFVLAWVAFELTFWLRGDRPTVLTLSHEAVSLHDPRAGRHIELPLRDIHAATVFLRPHTVPHRVQAVLVLSDVRSVRLAVRLLVEPTVPFTQEDVQADAMDALLGGTGGMRGLAPTAASARQVIDDPAGQAITWLRDHLDPTVWSRTSIRVWQGAEPPLDTFGVHEGEPDGLLTLEGDSWTLTTGGPSRQGTVTLIHSARAERRVALARPGRWDDETPAADITHDQVTVPLLLLELDEDLVLAVPSPGAEAATSLRAPDGTWWHTHVPEGGAAVWHILTRWPEIAWPVALRQRAAQALANLPPAPSEPRSRPRSRSASRPS